MDILFPSTMNTEQLDLFRTEVCDRQLRQRDCSNKESCMYSHCLSWRRRNPSELPYRAQLCPNVLFHISNGNMRVFNYCKRGRACVFSHSKEEQMFHPSVYKTSICRDFPKCPRYYCPFAHGDIEMREPPIMEYADEENDSLNKFKSGKKVTDESIKKTKRKTAIQTNPVLLEMHREYHRLNREHNLNNEPYMPAIKLADDILKHGLSNKPVASTELSGGYINNTQEQSEYAIHQGNFKPPTGMFCVPPPVPGSQSLCHPFHKNDHHHQSVQSKHSGGSVIQSGSISSSVPLMIESKTPLNNRNTSFPPVAASYTTGCGNDLSTNACTVHSSHASNNINNRGLASPYVSSHSSNHMQQQQQLIASSSKANCVQHNKYSHNHFHATPQPPQNSSSKPAPHSSRTGDDDASVTSVLPLSTVCRACSPSSLAAALVVSPPVSSPNSVHVSADPSSGSCPAPTEDTAQLQGNDGMKLSRRARRRARANAFQQQQLDKARGLNDGFNHHHDANSLVAHSEAVSSATGGGWVQATTSTHQSISTYDERHMQSSYYEPYGSSSYLVEGGLENRMPTIHSIGSNMKHLSDEDDDENELFKFFPAPGMGTVFPFPTAPQSKIVVAGGVVLDSIEMLRQQQLQQQEEQRQRTMRPSFNTPYQFTNGSVWNSARQPTHVSSFQPTPGYHPSSYYPPASRYGLYDPPLHSSPFQSSLMSSQNTHHHHHHHQHDEYVGQNHRMVNGPSHHQIYEDVPSTSLYSHSTNIESSSSNSSYPQQQQQQQQQLNQYNPSYFAVSNNNNGFSPNINNPMQQSQQNQFMPQHQHQSLNVFQHHQISNSLSPASPRTTAAAVDGGVIANQMVAGSPYEMTALSEGFWTADPWSHKQTGGVKNASNMRGDGKSFRSADQAGFIGTSPFAHPSLNNNHNSNINNNNGTSRQQSGLLQRNPSLNNIHPSQNSSPNNNALLLLSSPSHAPLSQDQQQQLISSLPPHSDIESQSCHSSEAALPVIQGGYYPPDILRGRLPPHVTSMMQQRIPENVLSSIIPQHLQVVGSGGDNGENLTAFPVQQQSQNQGLKQAPNANLVSSSGISAGNLQHQQNTSGGVRLSMLAETSNSPFASSASRTSSSSVLHTHLQSSGSDHVVITSHVLAPLDLLDSPLS